jgi:hypothetical protein
VKSLGLDAPTGRRLKLLELVGSDEPVRWRQDQTGLHIERPARLPSADVISFRATFE